jgi:N-acetylglucosaminyldiphosphoundecaprenol N-acetyl-beta-D-mannosaminyltransferase
VKFWIGPDSVQVNMPDLATLEAEVSRRFAARQGFAMATLNLDHLVKLANSATFRTAYSAQDLVTADGNPVVWMSRAAGQPVSLLAGSDLVLPLCRIAAAQGVTIAMVGSTAPSLAAAADAVRATVPGVEVAVCIAPPMGFDPSGPAAQAILAQVQASGAGLCFVALGAPKQEIFAALGRKQTPGIGFASVGAALDFLSGRQQRAPAWVRRISMEWMWRMVSDPRRMVLRYTRSALVFPGHMWRSIRRRNRI